jgi:hypothetical protein
VVSDRDAQPGRFANTRKGPLISMRADRAVCHIMLLISLVSYSPSPSSEESANYRFRRVGIDASARARGLGCSRSWIELEQHFLAPRRLRRITNAESFREYRKACLLPRNLLHPALVTAMWTTFTRGEYDTAVFQAFKTVEIRAREAAQFASRDLGVPPMRSAFHPETGPLRDPQQDPAERQALMELFSGAIGSYKTRTAIAT